MFIIPNNSRQNVVILFFKLNSICLTSKLPSLTSSFLKKKKKKFSTLRSSCSVQDLRFSLWGHVGSLAEYELLAVACGIMWHVGPGIQPEPFLWECCLRHWTTRETLASSFRTQLLPFCSWTSRIQSLDLSCVFFSFLSCFIIKLWSLFRF